MKLIFLAAVILVVNGSPLDSSCSWGPSYWCQSADVAASCGKTTYCENKVWKNNVRITNPRTKTEVNSVECDVCELVARYVLSYIEGNSTESEVKKEIESLCTFLGSEASVCDSLVDDYFDTIWSLLINSTSADEVCSIIGLCSSSKVSVARKVPLTATPTTLVRSKSPFSSVTCKICDFLSEVVVLTFKKEASKEDAKNELLKACEIPKPVVTECTQFVNKYFNKLWSKLQDKTESPQLVCSELFDFCPAETSRSRRSIISTVKCTTCKEAMKVAEKFINVDKITVDQIDNMLDKSCSSLKSGDAVMCKAIIDDIMKYLWPDVQKLLSNLTTPEDICDLIGFCSKKSVLSTAMALYKTTPISLPPSFPKVKQVKDGTCDICTLLVNLMSVYVNTSTSEEQVKEETLKGCTYLPDDLKSECTSVVDEYFGVFWSLVQTEFENDLICSQLRYCTSISTDPSKLVKSLPKAKTVNQLQLGTATCDVCKLVASFIGTYVSANATEAEAKNAVLDFCSSLPILQSECSGLVNQYFDQIWALLKNDVTTGAVCSQIGLCPSSSTTYLKLKQVKQPTQDICDLCKLATVLLKQYVDANSTETEAKTALEQVCNLLPSAEKVLCTSLIEENFDTIWSLLRQEIDSDDICTRIGLCNSTSAAQLKMVKLVQKKKLVKQPTQDTCDLCKAVMSFIKPYFDSSSTKAEVKEAMNEFCNLLPSTISSNCSTLVGSYFDLIWTLLESEVDSGEICNQIGLCNSTSTTHLKLVKPVPRTKQVKVKQPKQDLCDLCKTVTVLVKSYVDSNSTEQEVKSALEELCSLVPSTLQSECTDLVDTYFDAIWALLEQEVDSGEICTQIGLCNSTSTAQLKVVKPGYRAPQNVITCALCGLVLKTLEDNFNTSQIANATVATLEKVCKIVPSSATDECEKLIEEYGARIIEALVDGSTKEVCSLIGLCAATSAKKYTATPVKDDVCTGCTDVLTTIKNLMMNDPSLFQNVFDMLCNLMPTAIRAECTSLVNSFTDSIIDLIANAINPQSLCKDIKLCQALKKYDISKLKVSLKKVENGQKSKKVESGIIACDVCEKVLEEAEVLIPKEKDQIISALNEVCGELPSDVGDVCKLLLTEFGDQILDDIAGAINPRTDCKTLGVCKSRVVSPSLANPWRSLRPAAVKKNML